SSCQPGPGRLLCSLMHFQPGQGQLSWCQGQQELSAHVVAKAMGPSGDWSQQLLVPAAPVAAAIPPRRGVTSRCPGEHGSLEHPPSPHW
ncbi:DQB2 protein, partial [Certhia brachydactyla]|nr:DQB2 protein [Certhia brachydactyla]